MSKSAELAFLIQARAGAAATVALSRHVGDRLVYCAGAGKAARPLLGDGFDWRRYLVVAGPAADLM